MDPESAWEYELGVIQDFRPITLRAAIFYYDIHDFINDNGITSPGTGIGSDCLYNVDHFRQYGLELEASLEISDRFRGTLSYTYQDQDIENTGFEEDWTYYLPALLPNHKVKGLVRYMVWDRGWVQLTSSYVGERNRQQPGAEDLDEYITVDLGFEQSLSFLHGDWSLAASVNNITGEDYEEIGGYEMPEQVWSFQLKASF